MDKGGRITKIASAINAILIICDIICFSVWVGVAVKMQSAYTAYWWIPMPLIFITISCVSAYVARRFARKDACADAATLHIAASAVNIWDIIFANLYFVHALGLSRSLDLTKGISLSIIGFFYILDLICFLSSKDYTRFVNLDSFESNSFLRHKYGVIGGISLAVSNTVMLIISIFVSSFIVPIVACFVNLATILLSMAISVKKYGEKNYYL